MKIYILGSGVMAQSIAIGLKNGGFEVIIVGRNQERLTNLLSSGFKTELYGESYDIGQKHIILAIKPYALSEVSGLLKNRAKLCISVLARTGIEDIRSSVLSENYAICLPNIAAKFGLSITPFMSDGDIKLVKTVLDKIGIAIKFDTTAEFNSASVIAGCAPAYLALVAEALCNGAVLEGVKKDSAQVLVEGLFDGFAKLLKNEHPAVIKDAICSPGGTSIEGVAKLEKYGVRHAFIEAIRASANKQRS